MIQMRIPDYGILLKADRTITFKRWTYTEN